MQHICDKLLLLLLLLLCMWPSRACCRRHELCKCIRHRRSAEQQPPLASEQGC